MLKGMEYIYSVYKEKSFSKAAGKLFISQPALSAMVKKVELMVGAPLFDRSTTPISLTPAGEYYIESIEKVMAIQKDMEEYFSRFTNPADKRLTIGAGSFFCIYILPDIIKAFQAEYPDIAVEIIEGSSRDLAEDIDKGLLDLVFESQNQNYNIFSAVVWGAENLITVIPSDFKINEQLKDVRLSFEMVRSGAYLDPAIKGINPALLAKEPFILLKKGNDNYQRTLDICRRHGFVPNAIMHLDQMLTCYFVVCEGKGLSFIRDTIFSHVVETDKVCLYKIDDDLSRRELSFYYRKKGAALSKEAQLFLKFIRKQ